MPARESRRPARESAPLPPRLLHGAAILALAAAAGCNKPTAPVSLLPPAVAPVFALRDVNPNSLTLGKVVARDSLRGPAIVVYFGAAY